MADDAKLAFRNFTRHRLLKEMLGSIKKGDNPNDWKVLILDELTVKVMSSACKMGHIADEGISLVEDLKKRRQPLPLEAVYFVQAIEESVTKIVADLSGKAPMYKRAFIFFSSPVTPSVLDVIKNEKTVVSRLAALKEMNLEFLTIDTQGFVTDNSDALEILFGESSESGPAYDVCLETVATRLATVFASLKEYPAVRYKAPKAPATEDELPSARDLVPTKLAAAIWERLAKYKTSLPHFPKSETCDLIILDRTIDLIAPFIHDWSYDAMCHDLLSMEGNKYEYEVTTDGRPERKEVLLEEHDPVWFELRHLHIAEANLKLTEKMTEFGKKNKAAQIRLGAKEGQEISTRDMQKLVQALPQFREQLDKLSLHIQIATVLNEKISEQFLSDIAALEQDFAFGGGSSKELVKIFNTKQEMSLENKLRLLLIYAIAFPDKLDPTKCQQWMKLAKLGEEEMHIIHNLQHLGVPLTDKKTSKSRKAPPRRKGKTQDDASWDFSRFFPIIEDIMEELNKGELSKEDYPFVKEPAAPAAAQAKADTTTVAKGPQSMRTTKSTWASKHVNEASSSSNSTGEDRRIFLFIVGGATRSELKAVHKMTSKLKREIVLGSTSLNEPHQFLEKLKSLSKFKQVDIADIEID